MAYLVILLIQSIMFYSWYTGDHSYLNIITIGYTVIFILAFLLLPLMSYMSHNKDKIDEESIVAIRKWLNTSPIVTAVSFALMVITVLLMVMCGYVTLVVFYILLCIYAKICKAVANKNI